MNDKEVIMEAAKKTLDEAAVMVKAEQEGRQQLTEDLLFRMVEKDGQQKNKIILALICIVFLQILTVLAMLWL